MTNASSQLLPAASLAAAPAASHATGYRPDIDGLRAIAVVAVVVYHAGIAAIPGGFVGVDVFFVISGYLIGGQIFREARAGTFSFASFYMRRVRRILPALYAMLLVMLAAGLLLLTPQELRQLAREAVAAVLGLSNVLYYLGGGYFAPAADYNPLLMTWSLGVEEQFYLLFPFLVLGLLRFRIAPLPALIALSLLSFIGSIWLLGRDPNAAFYLLPTRAWELGLGAALALWEIDRRPGSGGGTRAAWFHHAAAAMGLALIAGSLVFYDKSSPFPGFFALLPTLGTALLIAAPGSAFNAGPLSSGIATFIGRVSYSWYLWHWPLFYLNRVLGGGHGGLPPLALILSSLGLGILSWRFVEQPFRHQNAPPSRMLSAYAAAGAAVIGMHVAIYLADGWPGRFSPLVREFAETARQSRGNPCLAPYGATALQKPSSCLPATGGERLVLFGDSHASALAPGIRSLAERLGLGFGEMTKSSCHPLFGYAAEVQQRPWHWAECIAYQQAALAHIERHPGIRTIVLAGFWSSADRGFRPAGREPGTSVGLEQALVATIERLRAMGRQVVLVQDVPLFRFDPYARMVGHLIPARAAVAGWLGNGVAGDFIGTPDEIIPAPAAAAVSAAAHGRGVPLIDPARWLCGPAGCRYGTGDKLYYFDFQHLTLQGALAAIGEAQLDRRDMR